MKDNILGINHNTTKSIKKITKEGREFQNNLAHKNEKELSINQSQINSQINNFKDKMNSVFLSPILNNKKKIINSNNRKAVIGQKLNAISKNIQNANEAIHNPNEFYMNFFNNIIKNESSANMNEKSDFKKFRSSKLLNGFIPNDRDNINSKSTKTAQKLQDKKSSKNNG